MSSPLFQQLSAFLLHGPSPTSSKKILCIQKKNWRDPAMEVSYDHHQSCLLTIEPGKGQSIPSFNPRNIPGSERNRVTTTLRATSGRLAWLIGMEENPCPLHHRTNL